MKLKDVETDGEEYSGKVMIEQVCTEHNHPLAKTPRVVKQMRCQKTKIRKYWNTLTISMIAMCHPSVFEPSSPICTAENHIVFYG